MIEEVQSLTLYSLVPRPSHPSVSRLQYALVLQVTNALCCLPVSFAFVLEASRHGCLPVQTPQSVAEREQDKRKWVRESHDYSNGHLEESHESVGGSHDTLAHLITILALVPNNWKCNSRPSTPFQVLHCDARWLFMHIAHTCTFFDASSSGLLLVALRAVRAAPWEENSTNANPLDRATPLPSTLSADLRIFTCREG